MWQTVITKCIRYYKVTDCNYKVRQVLKGVTDFIKSAPVITKCGSYFKVRRNKGYSPQHSLLLMIHMRKKAADSNKVFVPVLTDLSKAFDCICYDLLIQNMNSFCSIFFYVTYFLKIKTITLQIMLMIVPHSLFVAQQQKFYKISVSPKNNFLGLETIKWKQTMINFT